ncbi:MAG: multifunctional oxoglutarate decarboxylase/oxoglutarate dehydrogenase thiamine pyrophosphate-binding subunit/dihydrolipoyllysine-residue succinyltransferase subunit [Acidobacteria bacterium]|nr:multifunctional oxoglutarate decarboxylase/oxoglutarate dehydrogenase thiamine pyrophosphate-binding subunit/dihydrolipoyllysine-residue succinyltransferase subunit [Acidobacteriota bacterium]
MSSQKDLLVNRMLEAFGDNASFALDLYAHYRVDPASVGDDWRRAFHDLESQAGVETAPLPEPPSPRLALPAPAPAAPAAPAAAVPARSAVTAVTYPAPREGETAQPMYGGPATVARNMDASLAMPTATSNRVISVKVMEENRRLLNQHREAFAQSKISFTHFVAWAMVQALLKHPGMNDAYGEADGKPVRVKKPNVNLGIAVDVQKKDGSRTLMVPNIKNAQALTFPQFLAAFDDMVQKARKNAIDPEAFQGTTISLTNPGTVGTFASAPRLMPGQGAIIATGAMAYPTEFSAMPEEVLGALGIARVMNVSSTYDHRIIQGAESGLFLGTLQDLLQGGAGFYENVFATLKVPYLPVTWEKDEGSPFYQGGRSSEAVEKQAKVLPLINAYRVRGHLAADLDPLGADGVKTHPDLDPGAYGFTLWDLDRKFYTNGLAGTQKATLREIIEVLRQTYCGKIGAEYMYIQDPEQKRWLMDRMESTRNKLQPSPEVRKKILGKLVEAESFEKFLHTKYVGHKRFSLEGGESAVALMDRLLDRAAEAGIVDAVIGMPHRGRLTTLATVVGKPCEKIFNEFEDVADDTIQGSGDVKYHLGAVGEHIAPGGQKLTVGLAPNPSHLEFVDPVVEGVVRAMQDRLGDHERKKVLPILLHGDAAFAGQGIVAETINMSLLTGYATGGTVHVVVNNQIGFTTNPADAHSSPYCTDVAKMIQSPVFHVNGDDPEAVVHVVDIALDFRNTFGRDVVIDMVCYRRYGHNEGDEPSYTQPLLYQKIKAMASVAHRYQEVLLREKAVTQAEVDALWAEKKAELDAAYTNRGGAARLFVDSLALPARPVYAEGDARQNILGVIQAISTVPEGFELHPKLRPVLKKRADFATGDIDWAGAEALAFGTLLQKGVPVRLSGQDCGRGTFSQRHSVLADYQTGKEIVSLNATPGARAKFEVLDSLLSEAGVMGFEFGYSVADPAALVLWEGQFGDFANGAQVIIDQFISGSEQKWNQKCSLVLLLPHGQEGQGPEHSSARLERFLTLCAEDNLRVMNLTTPAQYFHALVRQATLEAKKPLILMSPKSLLRHPKAVSTLSDLLEGTFQPVLDDDAFRGRPTDGVRRIVFTSGKVSYELFAAREKQTGGEVAIVRLEQIYPFPAADIARVLSRYPRQAELVWAQEEPRNMGAWRFVREQLLDGKVEGEVRALRYIGRRELASPAPGSHHVFQAEQDAFVAEAVRVSSRSAVPA